MSTQVILNLPDKVYNQAARLAELMNQDVPIRNEEFELAEEPEAHGHQDGDRCEYGVGDHRCVSFSRKR